MPDPTACNGILFPSDLTQPSTDYLHPAPYSITGFDVRNNNGQNSVGYNFDGTLIGGISHTYVIDKNIDLTIINPEEKIIYNPSEVEITADDLIFPSSYTFKTIRGIYPTAAEVNAANTAANGGPYTDLRQVPVPTDLRNSLYPTQPNKASIYTLKSGSKLTIRPCVTIYDATFIVETGAILIYDPSLTYGRYEIVNNGGTVSIEAFNLLFQNQIITATKIYEAKNSIVAGTNVNPNKPVGPFIVGVGGDVTLKAEKSISLKPGFSAKSGSKFHAFIGTVDKPSCSEY